MSNKKELEGRIVALEEECKYLRSFMYSVNEVLDDKIAKICQHVGIELIKPDGYIIRSIK